MKCEVCGRTRDELPIEKVRGLEEDIVLCEKCASKWQRCPVCWELVGALLSDGDVRACSNDCLLKGKQVVRESNEILTAIEPVARKALADRRPESVVCACICLMCSFANSLAEAHLAAKKRSPNGKVSTPVPTIPDSNLDNIRRGLATMAYLILDLDPEIAELIAGEGEE